MQLCAVYYDVEAHSALYLSIPSAAVVMAVSSGEVRKSAAYYSYYISLFQSLPASQVQLRII